LNPLGGPLAGIRHPLDQLFDLTANVAGSDTTCVPDRSTEIMVHAAGVGDVSDLAVLARLHLSGLASHLTLRQIVLLGMICDDPDVGSTGEIAKKLGLTKPVITRAVRAFEVLGLATSHRSPTDGRCRVIIPTEAGFQLRASFKSGGT